MGAKASAASIHCLGASATCTTATCCDLNPDLCGGAAAVACTTPATQYWDSAKAGTTRGTTPGTACCSTKANCGSHTCAAGYKAKASAASITCLGASATCTTGTCCDLNPDLCGGAAAVACTFPSTHYWD